MVAIYTRQSVDKKDSISIDSQIELCKRELHDKRYKVYSDKGYSGKDTNRPEFEQMMSDIKSGLIDKVVVYKLDRISRSILDFSQIIEIFNKHNVDFQSTQEKFDTSTPIGNAMLSITMVFAQLERETIQQRIKDNYYARGKKGFYMGGRAPYGYTKVPTVADGKKTYTLEPNTHQYENLINIYEMYANSDLSLGGVSRKLNSKKIPAPAGGNWDSCKLSRIMRNPVYVKANASVYLYYKNRGCIMSNDVSDYIGVFGCYLYGRRESNERKYTNVKDHVVSIALHEGLVDSDTFLQCQYKLDKNRQIKNTGKGKYTWLSGLIKCGNCGYSISVSRNVDGRECLICRGKHGVNVCEGIGRTVLLKEVEHDVERQFLRIICSKKDLVYKQEKENNKAENEFKIQVAQIEEQIANLRGANS